MQGNRLTILAVKVLLMPVAIVLGSCTKPADSKKQSPKDVEPRATKQPPPGDPRPRASKDHSPGDIARNFVAALAKGDLETARGYLVTVEAFRAMCAEQAKTEQAKKGCLANAAGAVKSIGSQLTWMAKSVPRDYRIGKVQLLDKKHHDLVRALGITSIQSDHLQLYAAKPHGKPEACGVLVQIVKMGGQHRVYLPYYPRPRPASTPHWTKNLPDPYKKLD